MTRTATIPEATTTAMGFRPYRLTVERYHRMIAAGVFDERDRVILWKGRLVERMTKGAPHSNTVINLIAGLFRVVPAGWHVRPEQPIMLGDDSEPEPDLTIVRGSTRDYPEAPPGASDVGLVVEVADSSLGVDAGEVLRAYAGEAIPIYWLVNLRLGRVEVYQDPTGPEETPGYRSRREYGPDDEVPVVLDGHEVGRLAVREVLP